MSHTIVVGMGEVGSSLARVLARNKGLKVYTKDLEPADIPENPDLLHICLNYVALGKEKWLGLVRGYIEEYKPRLVDICSTVPPGTTRLLGPIAVHSTTRGLHPHLEEGLLNIAKHVGGPRARDVAAYYARAGVRCMTHGKPETTEVAHLAHLLDYGLQLMSADMRQQFCRHANVDYIEAVIKYTDTHNAGFLAMDMPSKVRMNLTPPNGRIGGHCVIQAAKVAAEIGFKHPLVEMLAGYGA